MRKTLLVFLSLLSLASMLSGCFWYPYPHGYDYNDRGYYRYDRGHHGDRDYDDRRGGDRDYR